ncbi:MAG TPA: hypothetical protein VHW67_10000 [Solirubrobacteraceae bacterium]|jgi:H+/Cl- antiporter ClcA|nr:hypothetical protein [Solirubrobacteraceae bacterium]
MAAHRWDIWRARTSRICVCAVLLLAFTGSAAPAALAAGTSAGGEGAFNELSQAAEKEATQTQKTETSGVTESTSTSNSKKTVIIIVIAAIVLLVAIAGVIVRDARKMAPAGDPQLAEARSAQDSAAALRKRRQKAKAARQQRKRNR